jgi:hypothetical protein
MVQVHYGEGVATRTGPEPCTTACEGSGEASAGEHTGQPLVRQESWRGPAGGSPARVRGSSRSVASVALWKATTTAKRTQQSCGVWG